jgi:uncharacterized protein YxjI
MKQKLGTMKDTLEISDTEGFSTYKVLSKMLTGKVSKRSIMFSIADHLKSLGEISSHHALL